MINIQVVKKINYNISLPNHVIHIYTEIEH